MTTTDHPPLIEETNSEPASSGAVDSTVWGDSGLGNCIHTLWEYTRIAVEWLRDCQTTTGGESAVNVPDMGEA